MKGERIQSSAYLDKLEPYFPVLSNFCGMDVLRGKQSRDILVTNGITSCTIQLPPYCEDGLDLTETLKQAAENVENQTLKMMETYDC